MLATALSLLLLAPAELTPVEARIRDRVHARRDEAIAMVEDVSNINSGSLNVAGVRAVAEIFAARFRKIGFDVRLVPAPKGSKRGPGLFATRRGDRGRKLLLIGHLDTVFEPGDGFDRVVRRDGYMHGPGVFDMKGGDVAVLYALEALHAEGALDGADITVAFTGDEEKTAKPLEEARAALIAAAKHADVALGFEPAFGDHRVSIARRGSSSWTLEVTADGGHSSRVGAAGAKYGAAYEAARLLGVMRGLVDGSKTLTLNPGVLVAGSEARLRAGHSQGEASGKTNRIATTARVSGDLRFIDEAEKAAARRALVAATKDSLPGTKAVFRFVDGYPAMSPRAANRALFGTLDGVSRDLGYGPLGLVPPQDRGAADISFAAPHVEACLAGLGVAGSGAHDPSERMKIAHLEVATVRAALLVLRLTR